MIVKERLVYWNVRNGKFYSFFCQILFLRQQNPYWLLMDKKKLLYQTVLATVRVLMMGRILILSVKNIGLSTDHYTKLSDKFFGVCEITCVGHKRTYLFLYMPFADVFLIYTRPVCSFEVFFYVLLLSDDIFIIKKREQSGAAILRSFW